MIQFRILILILFGVSLTNLSFAQVMLDANKNILAYNDNEENVTIEAACISIKGSGGIVSENGKQTICPNKTSKQKCAKLSLWDAIRYKLGEIFSRPNSGDDVDDIMVLSEELNICSSDNDSLNFTFPKGAKFKVIAEGVFQTDLENLVIVHE